MAKDLAKTIRAAVEAVVQESGNSKKRRLTTGPALLTGAGLMTVGRLMTRSKGGGLLQSARGDQEVLDEDEELYEDEPEAEGVDEYEELEDEEPEDEADEDFDDEEPEDEADEDFDDEEPEDEADEDFDDEEPEEHPRSRRRRSRSRT
jgi:hypothetical protein